MKTLAKATLNLFCALFLIVAISIGVHFGCEHYDQHLTDSNISEMTTFDDIDSTDSTTIEDHLKFRWEIMESMRIDSVYLYMPDKALISILSSFGTELSNSEIVYIYESNKDVYNSSTFGKTIDATIESFKHNTIEDIKKEYLHFPDEIPIETVTKD